MLLAWTIGPLELVVIIAVILLVLGPSKLPALGESVGKMLRSFRKEMKQIEHDKKQEAERQHCVYNFEEADVPMLLSLFDSYEKESLRIAEKGLVFPAFDLALKCSHTFNLLDARGGISVTERASYINRVRTLSRKCCLQYLKQREERGYPLLANAA